jgi:hypothetical protein
MGWWGRLLMGNNMVDGYKFYNIRKYRGVIMKAVILSRGKIVVEELFL